MNERLSYNLSQDSARELQNRLVRAGYTVDVFGTVDVASSRRRRDVNFPVDEAFPGVTVPVAHIGSSPFGEHYFDIVNSHLPTLAVYHAELRRLAGLIFMFFNKFVDFV